MTPARNDGERMGTLGHLESVAREWLAQPERIPLFERPRVARRRVRLWHHPSLRGPWVSLLLYEGDARRFHPSGMSPAFEVTWDRGRDAELVRVGEPTAAAPESPSVTWRRCLLPTELVQRRYQALQRLVFRPFSLSGIGTDGFTRGVEGTLGFGATSIAWWGTAPEDFEPLARWYEEVWDEVRRGMSTA